MHLTRGTTIILLAQGETPPICCPMTSGPSLSPTPIPSPAPDPTSEISQAYDTPIPTQAPTSDRDASWVSGIIALALLPLEIILLAKGYYKCCAPQAHRDRIDAMLNAWRTRVLTSWGATSMASRTEQSDLPQRRGSGRVD
jgi:hypothetical protein